MKAKLIFILIAIGTALTACGTSTGPGMPPAKFEAAETLPAGLTTLFQ